MSGGGEKPWWRQLWGVPPWMSRSGKAPLTDLDIWTWRLGIPALLAIAALLWVAFGSPIPLVSLLVVGGLQWAYLTSAQRAQVLRRRAH
jgi:hypothetical protein